MLNPVVALHSDPRPVVWRVSSGLGCVIDSAKRLEGSLMRASYL